MGQSSTRPLDSPPGGVDSGERSERSERHERRSGGGSGFHNLHLSLGGHHHGHSSSSAGPSSQPNRPPSPPTLANLPANEYALGKLPSSLSQPVLSAADIDAAPSADGEQVEGYVVPQGVYPEAPHDYHRLVVRAQILKRRLAPFYAPLPGAEEPEGSEECPICFLTYPARINRTRCCAQPMCSECFVQIKRADPSHTNPPSSEPAACPYCMTPPFGVRYSRAAEGKRGERKEETSAEEAQEIAEAAAAGRKVGVERNKTEEDVVWIDDIRPDWEAKLQAALATLARRANRRIIMRQVGERLIPIGVSSSRVGADLPHGEGPGGAIILREGERWGREEQVVNNASGSSSRRRRLQAALMGDGPDMEEIMMMEAMRLSLLEHEEQQRRQAAAAAAAKTSSSSPPPATAGAGTSSTSPSAAASSSTTTAAAPAAAAAPSSPATPRSSRTTTGAAPQATARSSSHLTPSSSARDVSSASGSTAPVPAQAQPMDARQLGLSDATLAELAELVEGVPIVHGRGTSEGGSAVPSQPTQPSTTPLNQSALPTATSSNNVASSVSHAHSSSMGAATSAPGSPSRVGTNPNNPFRRLASPPGSPAPAQSPLRGAGK